MINEWYILSNQNLTLWPDLTLVFKLNIFDWHEEKKLWSLCYLLLIKRYDCLNKSTIVVIFLKCTINEYVDEKGG